MRKVIFLGAGASVDAGYPLASNLYKKLEEEYERTSFCNYKSAWRTFNDNLNVIKNSYADFKNCENLEYLITVISLLEELHEGKSEINLENLNDESAVDNALRSNNLFEKYLTAKSMLIECIGHFMGNKNFLMQQSEYEYLCVFFKKILSKGDSVITTNYDLLAERVLKDCGLWCIRDGYGFKVSFSIAKKCEKLISKYNSKKSQIKIFKLHGSVGWIDTDNDIAISPQYMKPILPKSLSGCALKDAKYIPLDHQNRFLILPSFIKSYNNKKIQDIWVQAAEKLQSAVELHVIGFSLPAYDTNIRTLLLPIYKNLSRGKCKVKIYTTQADKKAKERWKSFMGGGMPNL